MRALVKRGLRVRYAVLAAAGALIWLADFAPGDDADWHFFIDGAHALTGPAGLHVYAQMPYLQFGPLALMLGVAFRELGPSHGWALMSAFDMALGLVAIRFLESAAVACGVTAKRAALTVVLGGPFLLAAWASPGVSQGHPDDILALVAVAAGVWAMATRRWAASAVLVGLASAAKPWALLCLPLAAAYEGRRLRGTGLALAAAALPWLPFFLATPSTSRVGQFHIGVEATSTLHYLGMAVGSQPAWPRYAQLGVALAVGSVAILRGRWFLVPLIAFAVRINLDAGAVDYYAAGSVMGAFVWDAVAPLRVPALRSILVWFALLYVVDDVGALHVRGSAYDAAVVVMRLAVLLAAAYAVMQRRSHQPRTGHSEPFTSVEAVTS